jgi:hypothetical protein
MEIEKDLNRFSGQRPKPRVRPVTLRAGLLGSATVLGTTWHRAAHKATGRPIVVLSQRDAERALERESRAWWRPGVTDNCYPMINDMQYLHGTIHQAKAYTPGNISGTDSHRWRKTVKGGKAQRERWRRGDGSRRRGSNEHRLNPTRPGEDEECAATPEKEREALGHMPHRERGNPW